MINEKPICIICRNSTNVDVLYEDIKSWDIKGEFNYFRCKECGLIFLYPKPLAIQLKKYYSSLDYWGLDNKKHSKSYWLNKADNDFGYIYKQVIIYYLVQDGEV